MTTKAPTKVCAAEGCRRPPRSNGLCQMHLKRAQRAARACGQSAGQRPAPKSRPPTTRPLNFTPSDQGFVHKNQHLTDFSEAPAGMKRVNQASLIGSGVTRYQIRGKPCPGCDGSGWCYKPWHPTFIPEESEHH